MLEDEIEIAVIQETKLMEDSATPNTNGWHVHIRERKIHRASKEQPQGGLAIVCRQGLETKRLDDLTLPRQAALESLGIEVATSKGKLQIWNMYLPPARVGDGREASLHLDAWPCKENVVICADGNAHGQWDKNSEADTRYKNRRLGSRQPDDHSQQLQRDKTWQHYDNEEYEGEKLQLQEGRLALV